MHFAFQSVTQSAGKGLENERRCLNNGGTSLVQKLG
jgi:hypothetical protein